MLYSFSVSRGVTTTSLIILYVKILQCMPINNGFSVKFNPISVKEEIKTKSFGAIFAKIPQELKPQDAEEIFSQKILPQIVDLGIGSSNQIAKILFPLKESHESSNFNQWHSTEFINIPLFKHSVSEYKIIVAAAPKNIRIGKEREGNPVVVYIIFPDDNESEHKSLNIPEIYFVNKRDGNCLFKHNKKVDPILVMNNTRMVTGLKSTEVSKFIKFKNKWTNNLNVHAAL